MRKFSVSRQLPQFPLICGFSWIETFTLLVLTRLVTRLSINNACMGEVCYNCIPFLSRPTLHNTSESSRLSLSPRDAPSSTLHIQTKKCIICCKTQAGRIRDKFRICESPNANWFLKATIFFKMEWIQERSIWKMQAMYLESICKLCKVSLTKKLITGVVSMDCC